MIVIKLSQNQIFNQNEPPKASNTILEFSNNHTSDDKQNVDDNVSLVILHEQSTNSNKSSNRKSNNPENNSYTVCFFSILQQPMFLCLKSYTKIL